MLMNYYRHINRNKIQFDFLVHRNFEASYDKEILELGGRIYHCSRLVPWSSTYKSALRAFFHEHPEYKIVHVHQDCLSSVALREAEECCVPVRIAHSHSSNQNKDLKYPIKLYYRNRIPTSATQLFACGKSAGDWMFQGQPYTILPNAIETKRYAPNDRVREEIRASLGLADEVVIGHVGRFNPVKNHSFLLKIFCEIIKRQPNAVLLLVGDGQGRRKVEHQAETLGIRNRVIFTGVRSDVNQLMQAMDVFVFPSLYEGLSVTIVEAQAAGVPCVISERVPKECILTTELITYKSLTARTGEWADHVLNRAKEGHSDHIQEIAIAGYDIGKAAQWLQEYYLGCMEVI